jgi:hypothetical protein
MDMCHTGGISNPKWFPKSNALVQSRHVLSAFPGFDNNFITFFPVPWIEDLAEG